MYCQNITCVYYECIYLARNIDINKGFICYCFPLFR